MSTPEVPAEVQELANRLGVSVEDVIAHQQQQQQAAQDAPTEEHEAPAEEQQETPTEEQAEPVQVVPTETPQERLERELAESRQETQQVRRLAQTATEGRVIGSGGGGLPGGTVTDLPNLGMIEPGIRYEYLNGMITDEQLSEKLSPLLAALLKNHEGGVI